MMGSRCSWWLLLVALLPPIFIAPVYCQHTEDYGFTFLVTVKNNESGLEVHTLSVPEVHGSLNDSHGASQRPDHELEPQMLFIPGHNLSSECGEQYFRCQELLVETVFLQGDDGGVLNIIFVPLEEGILLLSYWYGSNRLTSTMEWNIYSSNCNPIVFYKISGKFYMVCIRSYKYFAVYEIQLKLSGSIVEDVIITEPLITIVNTSNLSSPSNLSNFILVGHKVYFAVGNTITCMDIFDSTATKQYPELPLCTQIHKLVPTLRPDVRKEQLIIYCTDRYAFFDPSSYEDWNEKLLFSSNGIPYVCPDNNYTATFFTDGTLQISVQDSISSTISNVNISSGVCFEAQRKTYFAYADQQHNSVYLYDFVTQNHYPIFPYVCSQDCLQLHILGNEYLVVRDANYNIVLNAETNFSLIINISSGIADILVVLHGNTHSAITPSPPVIYITTTAKVPLSMNLTSTFTSIPNYIHVTSISLSPGSTTVTLYSTPTATGSPVSPTAVSLTAVSPTAVSPTAVSPTAVSPTAVSPVRTSLAAIVSTVVIGFSAIIVSVAVGFLIRYKQCCRDKNIFRIPRLRFITNQGSSASLLAADGAQEEEEEGESYEIELEAITNYSKESSFNWQGKKDSSNVVDQYNPTDI